MSGRWGPLLQARGRRRRQGAGGAWQATRAMQVPSAAILVHFTNRGTVTEVEPSPDLNRQEDGRR